MIPIGLYPSFNNLSAILAAVLPLERISSIMNKGDSLSKLPSICCLKPYSFYDSRSKPALIPVPLLTIPPTKKNEP